MSLQWFTHNHKALIFKMNDSLTEAFLIKIYAINLESLTNCWNET